MIMKTLITLLILGFSGYLNAQTTIKGTVREENGGPVEAASISLLNGSDSLAYKMSLTDKEGKFSFSAIPAGAYHILVSAVGHGTINGAGFTLSNGTKALE